MLRLSHDTVTDLAEFDLITDQKHSTLNNKRASSSSSTSSTTTTTTKTTNPNNISSHPSREFAEDTSDVTITKPPQSSTSVKDSTLSAINSSDKNSSKPPPKTTQPAQKIRHSSGVIVFKPSTKQSTMSDVEIPDSLFKLSGSELKNVLDRDAARKESEQTLRTRKMREIEKAKHTRVYTEAMIRIRFPDGLILQGSFKPRNKLAKVKQFIAENLADSSVPFYLCKFFITINTTVNIC